MRAKEFLHWIIYLTIACNAYSLRFSGFGRFVSKGVMSSRLHLSARPRPAATINRGFRDHPSFLIARSSIDGDSESEMDVDESLMQQVSDSEDEDSNAAVAAAAGITVEKHSNEPATISYCSALHKCQQRYLQQRQLADIRSRIKHDTTANDFRKDDESLSNDLNPLTDASFPPISSGAAISSAIANSSLVQTFQSLVSSLGDEAALNQRDYSATMSSHNPALSLTDQDIYDVLDKRCSVDFNNLTNTEKAWFLPPYADGVYQHNMTGVSDEDLLALEDWTKEDEPSVCRLKLVAYVTNSSNDSVALNTAQAVFDHAKAIFGEDSRINYQLHCVLTETGEEHPDMKGILQMWIECQNTYHLIDGYAMKEACGGVDTEAVLGEQGLKSIVDKMHWALFEDSSAGVMLSPRMRQIRLRGGASRMKNGFNTDTLDWDSKPIGGN